MARPGSIPVRNVLLTLVALAICLVAGCVTPSNSTSGGASVAGDGGTGKAPESEIRVRGGRIYPTANKSAPPFLRVASPSAGAGPGFGAESLTLELDLIADIPPTLQLLLIHCDRNWQPTQNMFIQDRTKLRASDFIIEAAPIGVRYYNYTARIEFPSESSPIILEYSGNYIARVVDYFDPERVIAEERFFAAESTAGVGLEMISDFYNSAQADAVQEGLRARVEVVPPIDLFNTQFTAIHLYEQGKWETPLIADPRSERRERKDGDYWATWAPYFAGKIIAEFFNIPSGNEHRILDLTDLMTYPPIDGVLTTPLSDEQRNGFFGDQGYDNNGIPRYEYVSPEDDDYVYFEFRLDLDGKQVANDLAVVGTFNDWTPTWDWRLVYDPASGYYVGRGWMKRAVHEYEYVTGSWDIDSGILRDAEATLLEGNSVYATQLWLAIAYYESNTGLMYDRIVGVGADMSGGR